jgi:hypothetical protein
LLVAGTARIRSHGQMRRNICAKPSRANRGCS